MSESGSKIDTRELELPETTYVRDIDNRVFAAIVLQCLAKIEGVELMGGSFIDTLLNREQIEGIRAEQDPKTRSVKVRVEVRIHYGTPIPEKSEEIQTSIAREITRLTGLHVSQIHVLVRGLFLPDETPLDPTSPKRSSSRPVLLNKEKDILNQDLAQEIKSEF